MSKDEVDTPALIVDLDVLEANLERMAASMGTSSAAVRMSGLPRRSMTVPGQVEPYAKAIVARQFGLSVAT
jgi:hypothetical protein